MCSLLSFNNNFQIVSTSQFEIKGHEHLNSDTTMLIFDWQLFFSVVVFVFVLPYFHLVHSLCYFLGFFLYSCLPPIPSQHFPFMGRGCIPLSLRHLETWRCISTPFSFPLLLAAESLGSPSHFFTLLAHIFVLLLFLFLFFLFFFWSASTFSRKKIQMLFPSELFMNPQQKRNVTII